MPLTPFLALRISEAEDVECEKKWEGAGGLKNPTRIKLVEDSDATSDAQFGHVDKLEPPNSWPGRP